MSTTAPITAQVPSCASCPFAKPLHVAVYCALDAEVRNLPASVGHLVEPPRVQLVPPEWCPRRTA